MKKLVMLSHESIFSGYVLSGVAELVDSLANSLSKDYDVTVVCHDGNGILSSLTANAQKAVDGVRTSRFSSVTYHMIKPELWWKKVPDVVEQLHPDILHNFADPGMLRTLHTRPPKAIYTIDHAKFVLITAEFLTDYDSVTTVSKNYASELLNIGDNLSKVLSKVDFHGITNGILTPVFAPEKGLLIPAKYTADDQTGKRACKEKLLQTYGITGEPYICLMMCRLVRDKGLDDIFAAVETVRDSGGILVVVGKGDAAYERHLMNLRRSDGVMYVGRWASPIQAAPLAAGADFYICPSITEPCGLMPMTASRYGAIPIVTQNGGLADNFNDENAIIINENGVSDAILRASKLYTDKDALTAKRKICMEQDFSWKTRKAGYIELYEKEVVTA